MKKYYDHTASSPILPQAIDAWIQAAQRFPANPSSAHDVGVQAHQALENARKKLLNLIAWPQASVVFTSSATEANNLSVQGHLRANPKTQVLIAEHCHPSLWNLIARFPDRIRPLSLPKGSLEPEHLARNLSHGSTLVCVSQACNETGRTVPIAALADCCAKHQAKLLVDAVQVPGRLPLPNFHPALAAMTMSAHKFGGPRGVGALIHHNLPMESVQVGGSQESGLRPGTENLPGILGMLSALETVLSKPQNLRQQIKYLWNAISDIPGIVLNSDLEQGLPGLLSVSIAGIQGSEIVADLSLQGFSISAGSACSAGGRDPSRQILLLGRSVSEALGSLRLSLGTEHTQTDLDALAQALKASVRRQR